MNCYNNIFKEIVNAVNTKHLYNWDDYQKGIAIREFRRFLELKNKYRDYKHNLLSPGPVIDDIWHEFLLRPQDYYNYCMLLSDKIIDHSPTIDVRETKGIISRYRNTLDFYKREYQEIPPAYIWPPINENTEPVNIEPVKKNNIEPVKLTNPSSTNKVVIYIIDKITEHGKTKTLTSSMYDKPKVLKITIPSDVSYWTLKAYISKILEIPYSTRIGLLGKSWDGTYDRNLEYETLSSDKKMKDFGMQNGSQYKLVNIPANMGC